MTAQVLVVEDSETQALALRRLLETEGYDVATVASAEAALERLNGPLPDVVVADFHLPGMDGRELSRQIRLNGRTRTLPLLMLTSARESDLERQGLESGVDAYVPKSADKGVMLVRLRALLREQRLGAGLSDPARAFRRAKVVIVHDSSVARMRLRHLLEQDGYETVEAAGVRDALAATDESVDCVVMPFLGAGFDGEALCAELAARRVHTASPFQIVVLGPGPDRPSDFAAAFAAGADDVAALEESEDVLRARIRALMRRKLLADENRHAQAAAARAAAADALEAANRQLRDTQAQLVQSAKMASLGELVAGIAHEINNPLAFLLGHHDTVERLVGEALAELPDRPEAQAALRKAADRLKAMRVGLQRIQGLVLNLRKFSRLDEAEKQVLDVPDAIGTVLALLKPKLRDIDVRLDLRARPQLFGSPALLNQVVMNIVSNAADALGREGAISIASDDSDGCYRIVIDDSGPGVPADLRDRIFEPFFTTKPVGAGTGLGLAIAYSVIRAHGGDIAVGDSPLGGARFTLSLPIEGAP